MESTDARKAFPCFVNIINSILVHDFNFLFKDEPAMKAKFKITARHDKDLFAMSNMPVAEIRNLFVFLSN
jgi:aminopeptidase N